MRTNIFVIGVEVGLVESYGGGKRVNIGDLSKILFEKKNLMSGT